MKEICQFLLENLMIFLQKLLHRIYTFKLVPRLATCTNIRMPLSVRINRSRHSSPLTHVRKPLRERAPRMAWRMMQRMTRRIGDWYTRHSPCHSRDCVNVVLYFTVKTVNFPVKIGRYSRKNPPPFLENCRKSWQPFQEKIFK